MVTAKAHGSRRIKQIAPKQPETINREADTKSAKRPNVKPVKTCLDVALAKTDPCQENNVF
jgi:hypothetical protein